MSTGKHIKYIAVACCLTMFACGNTGSKRSGDTEPGANGTVPQATAPQVAPQPPKLYGYRVVNTYSHDRQAYTQGLLWHEGYLYESTGLEGGSSLRKTTLAGEVVKKHELSDNYFAEGLAFLDGKLYQLTWLNNKIFVYDAETFELLKEINHRGELWGLAEDGKYLYISDGSDKVYVVDPADFSRVRILNVRTDRQKVDSINEMEYIDGEIWANMYGRNTVVRFDPETGAVKGIIDFNGILPAADRDATTDVMNGIAYDKATGRIFVTGKNWPKLFEVEVFEKR